MDDFELNRSAANAPPPSKGGPSILPVALISVAAIGLITGGAWWLTRHPAAPTNTSSKAVTATDAPLTPPAAAPELPPLDQMDPYLRKLLGALSTRPELARWLATDGLMQQLAGAIEAAAQGKSPARDFKVLAPTGPFTVARRSGRRTMDTAGYHRYDGLVATVTSIDASAVANIYQTIRPRLNEAYRKRGHPEGDVDLLVKEAIARLIETPILQDPIGLVEGTGARWAYADPKIEALSPSQKQLLRMGPDHTEAVLVWLRALRAAL